MQTRRAVLVGLTGAAVSACAPRGMIALVPGSAGVGEPRTVFVGTTRAAADGGPFLAERSPDISYARYVVSIPPAHVPGQIEHPGRDSLDPARHFVTLQEDRFVSAAAFRTQLAPDLRALALGQRDAVIYVHGFNNTFADGVYRIAQIGHDLKVPAVTVHYSWPSAGTPLNYGYDRDSVLFARDGLQTLIEEVRAAGAEHVILVAHSMGALLAMETLRQIEIGGTGSARRLVDAVVLFSPDIDIGLFREQALRIGNLPEPFVIFTSRRDRALTLSARLTGQKLARLGNLQDLSQVAELDVLVMDVSAFGDGSAMNHFAAVKSPALISLFSAVGTLDTSLGNDQAGRTGLFPGTVLTIQNATAIILSPVSAARRP